MTRWALALALLGCGEPPGGRRADRVPPDDPGWPSVTVRLPEDPAAVDDLVATPVLRGATADEVRWSWTVDGRPTGHDGPVVPAAALELGQRWRVRAAVGEGEHEVSAEAEVALDRLGGNVLIVLIDDVGVEQLAAYGEGDTYPLTPTIDALAAEGVRFTRAWAHPSCSPTRASLLTGRHPRRTGIGRWILPAETIDAFDPDEVILPELVAEAGYDASGAGKWHLTGFLDHPDYGPDPIRAGFPWYVGSVGNPDNGALDTGGALKSYWLWEQTVNGVPELEAGYLTVRTTNDALDRIDAMVEPWLLYVAYNAAHSPLHVPPDVLQPYALDPLTATDLERFTAMVTSLDSELGRLLDGLTPEVAARTTIVLMSDNGSAEHALPPGADPDRSKGSVYEGGVRVPLIVAGPAVRSPGAASDALVQDVDVFHTVAEIAGIDLDTVIDPRTGGPVRTDGLSFLPHVVDPALPSTRDLAYVSKHYPNGPPPYTWTHDAIRDERYKLALDWPSGTVWFFEYLSDGDEGPELLSQGSLTADQQAAYDRLAIELSAHIASMPWGP